MLNVVMLNVTNKLFTLSAIMLNVIMLSAVMLNVVVPCIRRQKVCFLLSKLASSTSDLSHLKSRPYLSKKYVKA